LRYEARALLAPFEGKDPATLRGELDARENLERQLGVNVGLLSDLESAIIVLGPLLAASITFLLPSRRLPSKPAGTHATLAWTNGHRGLAQGGNGPMVTERGLFIRSLPAMHVI
jgi:hypothetical protein